MVLQLSVRDIGQLTDFEIHRHQPSPGRTAYIANDLLVVVLDAYEAAHSLSAAVSIAVVHLTGNFQVSGS